MQEGVLITNSQAISSAGAANVSLLKLGTLTQTIIGVVITLAVIGATVTTITLISVGVGVQAPIANDDFVDIPKTLMRDIFVLANDRDPKGSNLTILSLTQPLHGSAIIAPSGKAVRYTPKPFYSGPDSLNYTITNDKATATARVFINVLNNPPVAVDFYFEINKNSNNNSFDMFNLVQEARRISDIDGDNLEISEISQPENGQATTDGQFVYYTPNLDFRSTDSFNYTVSDSYETDSAVITISIVNNPPVPQPDNIVVQKNTVVVMNLLENDSDPNNDNITIVALGGSKAVQEINEDGTVTYLPLAITDPYSDSFEYTVSDGDLTATSYVTIVMLNTPPVAYNNSLTCFKNTKNNRVGLGTVDADILDSLTVSLAQSFTQGAVELEQSTTNVNRFFADNWYTVAENTYTASYTPRKGHVGSDFIEFIVTDGYDQVSGFVEVTILNQAPVARDDITNCSKHLQTIIDVTANDEDPNGDGLRLINFTSIETHLGGRVERYSDSEVIYYAPKNTASTPVDDYFDYTISDIQEDSANELTATARVTVTLYNEPPVAAPDAITVPRNVKVDLDVLLNDSDPNNDAISITSVDEVNSDTATIAIIEKNGAQLVEIFGGNDVAKYDVPYTIEDIEGASDSSVIQITVVNTPPVAVDDSVELVWNQLVSFNVIQNDADLNQDELVVLDFSNPKNGSITISSDKKGFVYIPDRGFVGEDSFTYNNFDGFDQSVSPATVRIRVVNLAPIAVDDSASTHWADAVTIKVLENDSDPDSDTLSIKSVADPAHGSVETVSVDGTTGIRYTPSNYIGTVTFAYTITDTNLDATATVRVEVTNTAPVAVGESRTIHWATNTILIPVLNNDGDADNDPISISSATQPSQGTVSIEGNQIRYTVGASEVASLGTFTFTYIITDGAEESEPATVSVTVTNNAKPSAADFADTLHWREFLDGKTYQVSTQTSDGDGDSINLAIQSNTANFITEESGPGLSLKLSAPNSEWKTGSGSVSYTLSDGIESASGSIQLDVYNNAPKTTNITTEMHWTLLKNGIYFNVLSRSSDDDNLDANFVALDSLNLDQVEAGSQASIQTHLGVSQIFYKPSVGKIGSDIIVFYVTDGLAKTAGMVNITVSTIELTPQDQFYTIHWRSTYDNPIPLPLIANLNFTDDASLTLVSPALSEPDNGGTLAFPDTRSLTYKQAVGFLGTEKFQVQYKDGPADPQTISVSVEVENNRPTVQSLSERLHRREVLGGHEFRPLLTASDLDSDPITVTSAVKAGTTQGAVQLADSVITYTLPQASFITPTSGPAERYTFTVTDGVQSASGTVSLTIFNTVPTTFKKEIATHWRNLLPATNFWINVLTGNFLNGAAAANQDTDADPLDELTVLNVDTSKLSGASATLTAGTANVVFALTDVEEVNSKLTFEYVVTDGASNGQVRQTVEVVGTNQAPTAESFTVRQPWTQGTFSIPLTARMTDSNADDVTHLVAVDVSSSFATLSGDGKSIQISRSVTADDINRPITVDYRAFDGAQKSATARITIIFENNAPIANSFQATIAWNAVQNVPLLDLCSDPDGNDVSVRLVHGVVPSNVASLNSNTAAQTSIKGSLSLVNVATTTIRYTPAQAMVYNPTSSLAKVAVSTWTFTCFDGLLSTDGTVTITVQNTQPQAVDRVFDLARRPDVTQYVIEGFLAADARDGNGDLVSLLNVQGATVVNGRDISITVGRLQSSAQFTYQLTDGQLNSNTATVTVNVGNTAPTCSPVTRTLLKGESVTISIDQLCSDENGDALNIRSITNPSYGTGSLTNSNTRYTFTTSTSRSTTVVVTVVGQDPFGLSASTTITFTINNRSPTLQATTWNIVAARNSAVSRMNLANYLNMANAADADSYDSSRLTIRSTSAGTCGNSGVGSIAVQNGEIVFNRVFTFSTGSCSFSVTIQDADQDSSKVLTATASVTITVTTQPIVAVGKTISVRDGNGVFLLTNNDITENDYDPLGGTFVFEGFTYTECGPGFCREAAKPTANGDRWQFTTRSVQCQIDRFRYRIRSVQDPSIFAVGILNVQYTHCTCDVPLDLVFVIDSSGSVGSSNFNKIREFLASLTSNFAFAGDTNNPNNLGARMGIVRFSDRTKIDVISNMNNNKQQVINSINNMAYVGGGTWILDGLRKGVELLETQGRPNVVNKVILVLTDGEPNGPCNCGECRTRYTGTNAQRENQCKSDRYPYRTCNTCHLRNNWKFKCSPCSDTIPLAHSINSRKPDAQGNTPNGYWRVIPVGIGLALSSEESQQMLRDTSYDPTRSFYVQWDQLESLYQTVSDQTCNLVDIGGPAEPLRVVEPDEPEAIRCGDIVTLRGPTTYLYTDNRSGTSNALLNGMSTHPNTAGTDRRGLWQVVCRGAASGAPVSYGNEIALWNLHIKRFARRISNDRYGQVAATISDFNNNDRSLMWHTASEGSSTSGKIYHDNTVCLGSVTRSSSQYLASNVVQPQANAGCNGASQAIYMATIPWSQVNDLNVSPALSVGELPMTPN